MMYVHQENKADAGVVLNSDQDDYPKPSKWSISASVSNQYGHDLPIALIRERSHVIEHPIEKFLSCYFAVLLCLVGK